MPFDLQREIEQVQQWSGPRYSGKVTQVIGLLIESLGPHVYLGEICQIFGKEERPLLSQVVGFKDQKVLLMPLSEIAGISPGAEVFPTGQWHKIAVASSLLGRILDGLGNPIDDRGPLEKGTYYPVMAKSASVLSRKRVVEMLPTGVKSIDAFLTLGKGQRIGVFSEPGVGKSTLLGTLAKGAQADVNVIALIGERRREVREFIEKVLGKEGLAKSVIIVSTSDEMATLRCTGANVATAIAEYFRDTGKNVLLIMDSITRYAMALREVGLSAGESPTIGGYPTSVFSHLPKLLERAGNSSKGSITGVYSVLEENLGQDPIPEHLRALLDGHIVLSKKRARAYSFPAIDILQSLSRVMSDVVEKSHLQKAAYIRNLLHAYSETEELLEVGAYVKGSNQKVEKVIENLPQIQAFLEQDVEQFFSFEHTFSGLSDLLCP